MSDETEPALPRARRPQTGLHAWQATVGYISAEHSPDATLTLRVQPGEGDAVLWSAELTWGQSREHITAQPTLPDALRRLWRLVEQQHRIFKTIDAATRQPANYSPGDWVDAPTQAALDHLIGLTRAALAAEWQLIVIYQPVAYPQSRVRVRLLAGGGRVHIGGRGPAISEACRDLMYHAAPGFFTDPNAPPMPDP